MIVRRQAYTRAGLIGNPSDGFFGKTISFTFSNFAATVTLYETPELEILPSDRDHSHFTSIGQLADDVRRHGYYGGVRLLKAAIKRFHDYCRAHGIPLHDRNFTLRYDTTIPTQLGLAGSSAIITACFRALMEFYAVRIPREILPDVILKVETEELKIPAGLQDRVAQVYDGMVFMDFSRELLEGRGYGAYEPLDIALLPPLYIAYRTDLAEGTEVQHSGIRARWEAGEREVVEAMKTWAGFAEQVRALLLEGRGREIGPILNANFDLRRRIYRNISPGNIRMVETARSVGASAKFTGSGGAIVGSYEDEAMFVRVEAALAALGVKTIKPAYVPPPGRRTP